jgi:DNA polymerase elongation subunit (family B)
MHDTFRLLTFNAYDEKISSSDNEETGKNNKKEQEFLIQMFGINEKGETASIFVEGYNPFFYVLVGDDWNEPQRLGFTSQIKQDIGELYENDIVLTKLIKRKKLYGFDAGKQYKFLLIKFKNESAMKKAKGLWYDSYTSKNGDYNRVLSPNGYEYGDYGTKLYEAQIPPLLRLFHIKEISPSGWIALPEKSTLLHTTTKSTTCTYEFTINYKNIIPLPKKETRVPYKICSFDIEASSSHGDFPLAVKNYKKLATNIVDIWDRSEGQHQVDFLRRVIKTAFRIPGNSEEDVDIVYPKSVITEKDIDYLFDVWIKNKLSSKNQQLEDDDNQEIDVVDDDNNEETDVCDEGKVEENGETDVPVNVWNWKKMKSKPKPYKNKGSIIDLMNDPSADRDIRLLELNKTLTNTFPKLKGDIVTFIGSTFIKYGDDKPYLNHCISRDTCDDISNATIESYKTEKEVLLAWTKLIQREDPDIIIGYNIFGFDYQFLYQRAKELGCVQPFLQLSRNKNEVCLNRNWKTGKEGLEENTLFIASGQHDLKFVKMTGRLQIDLYNYLRRDYNLTSYKLDYVSGYFIGDSVNKIEHLNPDNKTKIYSKNLTGLESGNYVNFEEESHSVNSYKDGKKFEVSGVDKENGTFYIDSIETFDMNKKVKWGLAKDDVTPQDIFRMTNEGPKERATIAKYCIQDCNLVHHLMNKIDVMTGYIEMASLCSVPLDFLVMRGQGIKLTSYIAKKCREKKTLMPVIDKGNENEGYEGAIVLPPKCSLYLNDPVACLDYSSLYPSSMISENISHDSKVWTKEFDLNDKLLVETGETNEKGEYIYDNLPEYKYVDITYDTYKWQCKNGNPKAAKEKVKVGYKTCRFAQFPVGKAIMPSILEELLAARKSTRKLIPQQKDDFMKNVLDKRQLSIKVTANSMYGQTGAKTSTFYEIDCAASTTAIGRKLLTYGKRVIEEAYENRIVKTSKYGEVLTNAEYVYGDTDSVFFKFNLKEVSDGTPIIGQKALEITIELAQQAGVLASQFLKNPHDLEYEKTFLPFCLLSKKRYVGMLYELDPNKCKRKSMGIVLKRRDNAPIVKDVYGGVIDILMKQKNVEKAVEFIKECLQNIVDGKCVMDKLIITKALRSGYKAPDKIAHKVLADRIGKRDSGNKPSNGDRIPYIYIENPSKKALQGDKIETPEFIKANNIKIDYSFYISNQIMKPLLQVFALVLEELKDFKKKKGHTLRPWKKQLSDLKLKYPDNNKYIENVNKLREKEVKSIMFDPFLRVTDNMKRGYKEITAFMY